MSERHYCGCCGNAIGAGTRSDPLWCARCKPHIATGPVPTAPEDRTHFAQTGRDCPWQVR